MFFYPQEPLEGEGAKYREWNFVEANTWVVPATATANDIMEDRAYPHGWTLYAAANPLTEREWSQSASGTAAVGILVDAQRVNVLVVSDPDGMPWLVDMADPNVKR